MIYKDKKKILDIVFKSKRFKPYDKIICDFIEDLSKKLLSYKNLSDYPDLYYFAFWCRKSNIQKKKNQFLKNFSNRKSLGLIFHVPPSNIPTNFAYSFIFGLLTGNNNIIRVSKKTEPHSKIILKAIKSISKNKYKEIYNFNHFLYYEKDLLINEKISRSADARMIWGSNQTINSFKKFKTKPYCKDFNFFERFSICLLNSNKISNLNDFELQNFLKNFYNDTYLTDQAACSSPRIIYWYGKNIKSIQVFFWSKMLAFLKKQPFSLNEYTAIDKDVFSILNFEKNKDFIKDYFNYENLINIINLKKVPSNIDNFKGSNGFFYQYDLKKLNEINKTVNRNYQTLTYFGFSKKQIEKIILNKNLKGIDRAVPVGQSLNLDMNWDGIDLNNCLTREVVIL